jgi:hypothetical protein
MDSLHNTIHAFMCMYLVQLVTYLSEQKMFWTNVLEKNKVQNLCSIHFLRDTTECNFTELLH